MSIAELIMQGTNRASESTAWVGDSLAKLGQNVGKVLADREQQKQAQEMLPMFQQSMQDAMINANEGDSGLAFSKLMPFLTNPATLKNPYILPALDAGTKMIEIAANDYARNIQVQAYRDRYSGGGGNGGGLGSQEDIISAFTQGAPGYTDAEMAAQDVTDQTGAPAAVSPKVLYEGDIARQKAGLPVIQGQTGFPFKQVVDESMQRRAAQDQGMNALFIDALPEEQLSNLPQGPVNPPKNEPSQDTLKAFKKYSENFLDLPLRGQKEDRDKASIIFRDKENIDKYIQGKQKDRQFLEVASQSSVAVPGVFGVELPKEISKFVIAGGSLGKNGFTYRIDERQEGSQKAKDAVDWLNEWQQTAVKAESNTDIRNLLNQAGNDALNIEVSEKPISDDEDQISYNVQVRGNPQTAIQVTRDVYNDILELKLQTAAARTHGAKFLRMKQAQPTAQVPTQKSGQRRQMTDIFGNK